MERGRKRKRPITSCGECYRRKQKCDRDQPCAICVARGVPEKCTFGEYDYQVASQILEPTSRTLPKKAQTARVQAVDPPAYPQDLQGQTGYSLEKASSFSMLHNALNSTHESSITVETSSCRTFPRSVLSQISEIELQLPPQPVQCKLVDLFFARSWWWFLGVEAGDFRPKLNHYHEQKAECGAQLQAENASRARLDFIALLFQTLAVSLQYLSLRATDLWKDLHLYDEKSIIVLSERFSKAGDQIMEILGRQNSSVVAVQHDMVKGKWLKNVSRGKDSWYSLANAIRQAQELGLHVEKRTPASLAKAELNDWLWQNVMNRRLWACLVGWDAHVAFTLGRPRMIHTSDCDPMVVNTHEFPYDTHVNPPPDSAGDDSPSLLTPVAINYTVGYLVHDILNSGASKPGVKDYAVVGELHNRLCALSDNISPYFRYSNPDTSLDHTSKQLPEMRYHLVSMVNTYLVALHRAHTLQYVQSCDAAVQAALTTLRAQQSLFDIIEEQYWRIYTYSFFTIDAAIFLAALVLEQPRTLSSHWTNDIMTELRKALDRTEKMKEAIYMAKTGAQIIRKCYERIMQQGLGGSDVLANGGVVGDVASTVNPQELYESRSSMMTNGTLTYGQSAPSPSLRSWIEQMDQVMLPILEAGAGEPFDNVLWSALLED